MEKVILHAIYTGDDGKPLAFAKEILESGIQQQVKNEKGCNQYDYFVPLDGSNKVVLLENWENEAFMEEHKLGEPMAKIKELKAKYGIETKLERYQER